jgi:hypothetical protein
MNRRDSVPPDSGDDTVPMSRDELDALIAEQDPEYQGPWRAYVAPLRGKEE